MKRALTFNRFILRRKKDGAYYLGGSYGRRVNGQWAALEHALVFKTEAACKRSAHPWLYEKLATDKEWINPKFHPEWFDKKFEIIPVEVTIKLP